jgi:hypothetical protein
MIDITTLPAKYLSVSNWRVGNVFEAGSDQYVVTDYCGRHVTLFKLPLDERVKPGFVTGRISSNQELGNAIINKD